MLIQIFFSSLPKKLNFSPSSANLISKNINFKFISLSPLLPPLLVDIKLTT